ncbi:MAG TPA: GTPase HflX [Polyangiaceae bacterium]|nr:GTPase HflX [Polyangiaceae bacterium]
MTKPENPPGTLATEGPKLRALLLAAQLPAHTDHDVRVSLDELAALLKGLGIQPLERLVQKRPEASSSWVLGAGKLEELADLLRGHVGDDGQAPVVVYDGELSPGQQRNLEKALETEVFDRTEVILRIFARRAQTKTARLEVELARLNYEAPRARDDSALDAQAGGGGRGGKGHSNLELRKQLIRKRVAQVRQELEHETAQRHTRRTRREETPVVALVGYTNAGKSSLMRALTGADAYVENQLFATLGTTVRALPESQPRILVADTVGFIRNLPNHLLASFRTTLDEALDADLLLHVVDAADPEWRAQFAVTRAVLEEVDAANIPSLVVFNKLDKVAPGSEAELLAEHPSALCVSAHAPDDAARIRKALEAFFEADYEEATLEVPFAQGHLIGEIHARARVLSQSYTADGSVLSVRAQADLLEGWRDQLANRRS